MCGEDALRNVSSGVTGNLKEEWVREHREWCRTDPGAEDWLCVWADAVCLSVRESEHKQCFLAIVGCSARREKRLQALETAASEHNENLKALLRLAAATPERMLPGIPDLSGHVAPRLDPGAPARKNGRIAPPERPGLGVVPDMGLLGRPAAVIDWDACLTAPQNLWENLPPPDGGADPRAWMHVGG